jgi:hypothetical protein
MAIHFHHLQINNTTYLLHLKKAMGISFNMFLGGALCFIHAFLPFLFVSSASDIIRKLYYKL